MNKEIKDHIKRVLRKNLSSQKEVSKIIIFGSFVNSMEPRDIDIAVFLNSNEPYLSLAMKYRKLTREISKILPLDIIPIRPEAPKTSFFDEIEKGEMIYEK
jgi:predicted nucleotidyltransferase